MKTVFTKRGRFENIVNIQWLGGFVYLKQENGEVYKIPKQSFIRAEWQNETNGGAKR